jgi:hypothetical protein
VAAVIAKLLGIGAKPLYKPDTDNYTLGMLKGTKGRCAAVLALKPLSLIINQRSILVSELLYIEDFQLVIDTLKINDALNSSPLSKGKAYTPSSDKQQARKLATQAMYADWHDQYKKLKREHRKKSDSWISIQISRMDIAKDKSAETIRKNMKN